VLTVIAAAVALVAGVVLGAVVFGGDDEVSAPDSASADAAAGCQLLSGLPDSIPEAGEADEDDEFWTLEGPGTWRLQGASGAFSAAATAGGEYRSLGEDGEALYRAVQQLAVEDANEALDDLRGWCADHDLG
jgi:hypothetical protein